MKSRVQIIIMHAAWHFRPSRCLLNIGSESLWASESQFESYLVTFRVTVQVWTIDGGSCPDLGKKKTIDGGSFTLPRKCYFVIPTAWAPPIRRPTVSLQYIHIADDSENIAYPPNIKDTTCALKRCQVLGECGQLL